MAPDWYSSQPNAVRKSSLGCLYVNLIWYCGRRLLDAQLQRCIEEGTVLNMENENPVVGAMLNILKRDGLS